MNEIPSHLGYDYIQQVLASQGFATVSVRVNGINAQDFRLSDGGADARAQIVQEHLRHWEEPAIHWFNGGHVLGALNRSAILFMERSLRSIRFVGVDSEA